MHMYWYDAGSFIHFELKTLDKFCFEIIDKKNNQLLCVCDFDFGFFEMTFLSFRPLVPLV